MPLRNFFTTLVMLPGLLLMSSCAGKPLNPWTADSPPYALAVPIARNHRFIGSTFVDKNSYPREAMVEAVLRFIEEDLERRGR